MVCVGAESLRQSIHAVLIFRFSDPPSVHSPPLLLPISPGTSPLVVPRPGPVPASPPSPTHRLSSRPCSVSLVLLPPPTSGFRPCPPSPAASPAAHSHSLFYRAPPITPLQSPSVIPFQPKSSFAARRARTPLRCVFLSLPGLTRVPARVVRPLRAHLFPM